MIRPTLWVIGLGMVALVLTPLITPRRGANAAKKEYKITDLGKKKGDKRIGRGINRSGLIIGKMGSLLGTGTSAFIWTRQGGMQELNELADTEYSEATGVNDDGQVVGSVNRDAGVRAFLWSSQTGKLQELSLLPGDTSSQAYFINDVGQVAGYSSGQIGMRAVLWETNGNVINLGTLPGGTFSKAFRVNNRGQVAGSSGSAEGMRAFLWSSGKMVNLGTLTGDSESEALSLNDAGQVVGYSGTGEEAHAVLWESSGNLVNLGTLAGGTFSKAYQINNRGQVVGSSGSVDGTRAFLWTSAEGMQNLNNSVPDNTAYDLVEALSINENGDIVVVAKYKEGQEGTDHKHDDHQRPLTVLLLEAK